ncbi:hypothetical protein BB560_002671 [Smittium megazygosporum]|uniref:SEC7 domain-containing protein n=1 Tax=Smittium megazygosporum TaxID=133381 RepID=A0A2T9ZE66_9FUNG|nr:hypothetical protein BB560_002671 [Smittium megazygosporum]
MKNTNAMHLFRKDLIEREIDKVVFEMRKNVRWMNLPEIEELALIWIGSGNYPHISINKDRLATKADANLPQKGNVSSKPEPKTSVNLTGVSDKVPLTSLYKISIDFNLSDFYTFGALGTKLGLTKFTMGEEYSDLVNFASNKTEIELLGSFISVRQALKFIGNDLPPIEIVLNPFLSLINSGKATGPIARAALESIQNFIRNELFDFDSDSGRKPFIELTLAVTHCRFEATDSYSDETVLLQILETLRLIMTSKYGDLLSDASVCELLEAVLGMAFQRRLSQLVSLVFKKLNTFDHNLKNSENDANLGGDKSLMDSVYGVPSAQELLRVLSTIINPKDLQYTDAMRLLAIRALQTAIQTSGYFISNRQGLRSIVLDDLCHHLLLITGGNNISLINPAFNLLITIFQTHGDYAKIQFEFFVCQIVGRLMTPSTDPVPADLKGRKPSLQISDQKKSSKNLSNEFNSEKDNPASKNYFSNYKHGSGSEKVSLLDSEEELLHIFHYTHTTRASSPSYKTENQIYKHCGMKPGVRGVAVNGELRTVLTECFHRFLTLNPKLISNMWLNYDCDIRSGNLYDFLILFISSKAVPWPETRYEVESVAYLDILLNHLHHMAARNNVPHPSKAWSKLLGHSNPFNSTIFNEDDPRSGSKNKSAGLNEPATGHGKEYHGPDIGVLLERRKSKNVMKRAADLFNEKPALCLSFLQKIGYLPSENSAEMTFMFSKFLMETPALNKKLLGEYLSKPSNSEILHEYLKLFEFSNKRLDEAVRMLLGTFRLPGESQQIERIMEAFSNAYFATNPDDIATKDAAFILSFAIIMLNTDLHNPQVKSRMTFEDFCKNLRGVNDGQDFSQNFLTMVYQSIQNSEIVFPEEHYGEAGFEYCWREMLFHEHSFEYKNTDERSNFETTQKSDAKSSTQKVFSSWFSDNGSEPYDKIVFLSSWPAILQSLISTIVHCNNDHMLKLSISGIYSLLAIADRFKISKCMDEAITYLAQISGFFDENFLSDLNNDLNKQVLIYCSDIGPTRSDINLPKISSKTDTNPINSGELLKQLTEISVNVESSLKYPRIPRLLSEFYNSETLLRWELYERRAIPLSNLGIQLGKDYSGQIALLCLFLSVNQWTDNIGTKGWDSVISIIQSLVNADLISQKAKRTRNLISGVSTVPRKDTLRGYLKAKRRAIKSSFENESTRRYEPSNQKSGLFGTIASFLIGSPTFESSDSEDDYDGLKPGDYYDWFKIGSAPSAVALKTSLSDIQDGQEPKEDSSLFDTRDNIFISSFNSIKDGIGETSLLDLDSSEILRRLKPFQPTQPLQWNEPLDLLALLTFGSKKCIEACQIDTLFLSISKISDKSFTTMVSSLSRILLKFIAARDDEKSFSLSDVGLFSNSTDNLNMGSSYPNDKITPSDANSTIAAQSSVLKSNTNNLDVSVSSQPANQKTALHNNPSKVEDEVYNYDPGFLFFIELVGLICEQDPARSQILWNTLESPLKKIFENADSMNSFVLERLSGVLMRIAIASIVYEKTLALGNLSDDPNTAHSNGIFSNTPSNDRSSIVIVERVLRCIGLLRDCRRDTIRNVIDPIMYGLRVIFSLDLHTLVSPNNWPVVSSLLHHASFQTDNCLEYPSRSGKCTLEIALYLSRRFIGLNEDSANLADKAQVSLNDIVDVLYMMMPPEKLYLSVSGGYRNSINRDSMTKNMVLKTNRQKNAMTISSLILQQIIKLQFFARDKLFKFTFSPSGTSNTQSSLGSPSLSAVSGYRGFQLFSDWIRTLNLISNLCYSRQRFIRNDSFLSLQLALNRTEWLKLLYSLGNHSPVNPNNGSNSRKFDVSNYMSEVNFPSQWITSILQKILFPLSDILIRSDFLADYTMEETHMKFLSLLTGFFLNFSTELIRLPRGSFFLGSESFAESDTQFYSKDATIASSFEAIWIHIVEILIKYINIKSVIQPKSLVSPTMKPNDQLLDEKFATDPSRSSTYTHPATQSLLLAEVSQEHLKNMILVLNSLQVFDETASSDGLTNKPNISSGNEYIRNAGDALKSTSSVHREKNVSRNPLWDKTWTLIDNANPDLKPMWFPPEEVLPTEQTKAAGDDIPLLNQNPVPVDDKIANIGDPVSTNLPDSHYANIVSKEESPQNVDPSTESEILNTITS